VKRPPAGPRADSCVTFFHEHAAICQRAGYQHGYADGREAASSRQPQRVDQTILLGDTKRLGNCVSACVASYLGLDLEDVPHFVEHDPDVTVDGSTPITTWWWLLVGFMAAHGLWPVDLDDVDQAEPGEIVFVGGRSERGVLHQVLYRDGELWHDPHPSRAGVQTVTEVLAWRPRRHDHNPTEPR
jgi:hypothetical protein